MTTQQAFDHINKTDDIFDMPGFEFRKATTDWSNHQQFRDAMLAFAGFLQKAELLLSHYLDRAESENALRLIDVTREQAESLGAKQIPEILNHMERSLRKNGDYVPGRLLTEFYSCVRQMRANTVALEKN